MPGRKKGTPKTGGRKKGSKNKRTLAIEMGTEGMLPVDFMLSVMRNPRRPLELRCEMAKPAAPYLHAKRAPENKEANVPSIIVHTDLELPD